MAGFDVAIIAVLADARTRAQTRHVHRRPSRGPTAPLNAYAGGQLTWTDGTHTVRIPIVVRPVALAAPASVSGNGRSDQLRRDVRLHRRRSRRPPAASSRPRPSAAPSWTTRRTASRPAGPARSRSTWPSRPARPTPGSRCSTPTSAPAQRPRPVRLPRHDARRLQRRRHRRGGGEPPQPGRRRPTRSGCTASRCRQSVHVHALHLGARHRRRRQHDGERAGDRDPRRHRHDQPDLQRPRRRRRSTSARVAYGGATGLPNPTIVRVDTP